MKINNIYLVIAFSLLAISCSHYTIRENADARSYFGPVEDMHISQELSYPGSPFDALIKEAFGNNRHYINVLNKGDDVLLLITHLIRTAKKSINIQTFVWSDDASARFLSSELLKAAKRGVKVNIIVDYLAHQDIARSAKILKSVEPNIRVKYYNPVAKKVKYSQLQLLGNLITDFGKFNQRMHNKVFIFDDCLAITGGRNYRDSYFDRGKKSNFQDRDCLVIGPVVKQMTDSFMDYWAFKWSILNYDMVEMENEDNLSHRLEKSDYEFGLFDEVHRGASSYALIKDRFVEQAYPVECIEFIADGPGKTRLYQAFKSSPVAEELLKFISAAKKSVIIETPYLVLPKKMEKAFRKIRRKHPGIDMRISTNSLSSTDNIPAYALSCQNKKRYLKKLRWRIFEFKYKPGDLDLIIRPVNPQQRTDSYFTCIHAKTFVVDGQKVFIGSYNLDPRSTDLNTEAGLLIYDKKVAEAVADDIMLHMAPQNSWTIAKHKKVPLLAYFSRILEDLLRIIPIVDIWPFTYATSFGLVEGKEELPFYHKDFYKHYKLMGLFPDVAGTQKSIKTRLFKALFGRVAEPLI